MTLTKSDANKPTIALNLDFTFSTKAHKNYFFRQKFKNLSNLNSVRTSALSYYGTEFYGDTIQISTADVIRPYIWKKRYYSPYLLAMWAKRMLKNKKKTAQTPTSSLAKQTTVWDIIPPLFLKFPHTHLFIYLKPWCIRMRKLVVDIEPTSCKYLVIRNTDRDFTSRRRRIKKWVKK